MALLALMTFGFPGRAMDSLDWTENLRDGRLQIWIPERFVVAAARGSLRYLLPGNEPAQGWAGRVVFSQRTQGQDKRWTGSVNTDGSFGLEGLSTGVWDVKIKLRQKITVLGIAELSPEADQTATIEIPIPFPGYRKFRALDAKVHGRVSPVTYVRVLKDPVFVRGVRGTVIDFGGAVIPGADFVLTDLRRGLIYRTAKTNWLGRFELSDVELGEYVFEVLTPGFRSVMGKMIRDPNGKTDIQFRLWVQPIQ